MPGSASIAESRLSELIIYSKNPAENQQGFYFFGKKRDRKEEFYTERSGSRLPLTFHGYIIRGKYVGNIAGVKTIFDKNVNSIFLDSIGPEGYHDSIII